MTDQDNRQLTWTCPFCREAFSLTDFLDNERLLPRGMTYDEYSGVTVLYFDHDIPSCGTTFAVPTESFRQFISESIPQDDLYGTADCGEHCNKIEDIADCHRPCRNAPFRRFLRRLMERRARAARPQR
jgi:hypothetical protein